MRLEKNERDEFSVHFLTFFSTAHFLCPQHPSCHLAYLIHQSSKFECLINIIMNEAYVIIKDFIYWLSFSNIDYTITKSFVKISFTQWKKNDKIFLITPQSTYSVSYILSHYLRSYFIYHVGIILCTWKYHENLFFLNDFLRYCSIFKSNCNILNTVCVK